ncbi:hypothetical protein [Sunxiuqinia dokdonensis]|jgi:hypothetical protein|uniref:Uncharacterized protein n=1 Tax=Sunxiuqinia dokdonensis TaxID=1409788 RepID=A0A0L8VD12_9BACT|nr:hypothetical protein [Sunxiuqinia dokdonensis]KOH46228.1 hypothetical protein NC99_09560 [Sunxiuqinia dokdonensis]
MRQLLTLLTAGLFLAPINGKSQESYSLNRLLKHAIEYSHAIKKVALHQSEGGAKTGKAIVNERNTCCQCDYEIRPEITKTIKHYYHD